MPDVKKEDGGSGPSAGLTQRVLIYNIAQNMRKLRLNRKLSQKRVAAHLGVSYQQLQKYEAGRNRFPAEKLFALKQLYKVPYDAFFRDLGLGAGRAADLCRRVEALEDPRRREQIENILLILVDAAETQDKLAS